MSTSDPESELWRVNNTTGKNGSLRQMHWQKYLEAVLKAPVTKEQEAFKHPECR
jgi:hypothetical protein